MSQSRYILEIFCFASKIGVSDLDVRQKHENRADKWAIKQLIPKDKLDQAVAEGYTDLWQLAEYFEVSEEFMKKAICWYKFGNLDVEEYM